MKRALMASLRRASFAVNTGFLTSSFPVGQHENLGPADEQSDALKYPAGH
jgi:hypothetical protein